MELKRLPPPFRRPPTLNPVRYSLSAPTGPVPRAFMATSGMVATDYNCFQTGDYTITTYDPVGILLVQTRSYAYVGEDWFDDPPAYQSLSQAFNWQTPGPPQDWRTTPVGTVWYRDALASWATATAPSFSSLYAQAEQYQEYFNTNFCPLGCGLTQVWHYLYAEASRYYPNSHYAVGTPSKSGTYSYLLWHDVYNGSGGNCS